jgi:hypothetical protein
MDGGGAWPRPVILNSVGGVGGGDGGMASPHDPVRTMLYRLC